MTLVGPSQQRIFCGSMVLNRGQERDYLCWPCVSHELDRENLAEDKTQQATGKSTTRVRTHRSGHSPAPVSQSWIFNQLLKIVPRLMEGSSWKSGGFGSIPSLATFLMHDLGPLPLCLPIFPVYKIDVVIHGVLWDQGLKRSLKGEWPLLNCTSNCNNRTAELFVHLEP